MRAVIVVMLALGLAACGSRAELKPAPGRALPPAPYGRAAPPSADELLKAPSQAQPDRTVELRKRSEERTDDPYDLPPPE